MEGADHRGLGGEALGGLAGPILERSRRELLATGVNPSTQLQQGRRLAQDMLRSLAEGTGGAAVVDSNALAPTLERVASESSRSK